MRIEIARYGPEDCSSEQSKEQRRVEHNKAAMRTMASWREATDCLNRITTPALRLNNLNEWLMRMRRNAWRHFLPFTTN
jgi:hypothetical protein